jgi:hypothetical protein
MYATVRNGQKPEIAGSAGWHRSQEVIARELLGTLDQIKAQTHPGESILVAGMNMPFNPFYAPAFIQRDICACRWTVVQGASGPVTAGPGVRMARASDLEPLEAYNRLFVITPEGKLAGAFDPRRVPISPHQPDSPFGVEFLAGPNPALAQPDRPAKTTLKWSAPRSARIEIRALAPDGPVVAQGGSAGTVDIDPVGDGMVFFLQDASEGNPSAPEKTAAVVIMTVTAPLAANAGPLGH